jgi:hypothetical protein
VKLAGRRRGNHLTRSHRIAGQQQMATVALERQRVLHDSLGCLLAPCRRFARAA